MFLLEVWWEFSSIFGLHFMETLSVLKIVEWRTIGQEGYDTTTILSSLLVFFFNENEVGNIKTWQNF